ncbi:unnamed protein product [Haemonchus placei]|uniref:Uncharacterized protein n=1 Tax=Haemonchus placei TaxID=6290 RepID=A0A0N4W9Q8_HAEPC|nr:unnamed protein product [Haemonchus placei]
MRKTYFDEGYESKSGGGGGSETICDDGPSCSYSLPGEDSGVFAPEVNEDDGASGGGGSDGGGGTTPMLTFSVMAGTKKIN